MALTRKTTNGQTQNTALTPGTRAVAGSASHVVPVSNRVSPAGRRQSAALPFTSQALDAMFSGMDRLDPSIVPALEAACVDIQGVPKTRKSTLLAGDPTCAVLKFPEGSPAVPRAAATIIDCPDLNTFERNLDLLLERVAKIGIQNSPVKSVGLDPMVILVKTWYTDRELARANRQLRKRFDDDITYNRLPADAVFEGYTAISQLPEYNKYAPMATQLSTLLTSIRSVGLGWRTITHYRWGPAYKDGRPSGAEWQPDIHPSCARLITGTADVICIAKKVVSKNAKTGGYSSRFMLEFDTARGGSEAEGNVQDIGARLPMAPNGYLELPDYTQPLKTRSMWDVFAADYARAKEQFETEQTAYRAALAAEGSQS